ncbi:Uncharacterised protein [uncultured archaeon]|nr:Uncharacterised protein [uncultured archaeon]
MTSAIVNKEEYKRNFLTNVIFKVSFPKISELNAQNPPLKFKEKVADRFPNFKELKGEVFEFEVKSEAEDIALKQLKASSWEFSNKDKTKRVTIDPQFVSIEYSKYTDFKELFEELKLIFDTFFEVYPVKISKSIGLRYINQIKLPSGDPLDWNGILHESLFDLTRNFTDDNDNIIRSMHLLELKEKTHTLRFQFGLFNSEYPNIIARKEFALDYDCFTTEETDISEIFTKAKEFHEVIKKWFEKSIRNGLKDILKTVV